MNRIICYIRAFLTASALTFLLSSCANVPWNTADDGENNLLTQTKLKQLSPLSTESFINIPHDIEVLGQVQHIEAHQKNTFSAIARQYNLGYNELRIANPEVDPWLPGGGTSVYLPTMFVVPDAKREGLVVNLPSMRLLYFQHNSSQSHLRITSYPIGIGREGWATPTGSFHITEKTRNPNWYPPASVRAEHVELGDPLPAVVPAGPDNPLGLYKMRLSEPDYLIHGTNKPSGVGMRVSHGCIRLYPENIAALFESVPSKTNVQIINQPALAGWRDNELYLEVHPLLIEDERDLTALAYVAIDKALAKKQIDVSLNRQLIDSVIAEKRGLPFPVTDSAPDAQTFLAGARPIENRVPIETLVPAETIQQTASR